MSLFFGIVGMSTCFVIVFFILVMIKEGVCNLVKRKRRIYLYNHRFDKPPKAKCYCIDCKYYMSKPAGQCAKNNVNHCMDSWFCADAEPKIKEE